MFKIEKLVLYNFEGNSFTYNFEAGLNYFKGKNSSGKTVFYEFLDYMFGSSQRIKEKIWFKDTLQKARMVIVIDNISYELTRTQDLEENYLNLLDEQTENKLDSREYKDKLNVIFAKDINGLRRIREFTKEDLTYRAFTMFNFLGEKGQGAVVDFLDKCKKIEYSIKLNPILNFVFNNNLELIFNLQNELYDMISKLKSLENKSSKIDFINKQVNDKIRMLGIDILYNGKNINKIKEAILDIKNMQEIKNIRKPDNIAKLEVMYNNITEQIKVYENTIKDTKQFEIENNNRRILLSKLNQLISDDISFEYLVDPLKQLLEDLDNTISFSQYTINDNMIKELKKQRKALKEEIRKNDDRFKCYSLEEKSKAIAFIDDYLPENIKDYNAQITELRKMISEAKEQIKVLQQTDDIKKINEISKYITDLYLSSKDSSPLVEEDLRQNEFFIKYIKKGNRLQTMIVHTEISEEGKENREELNYYTGSMARHTLIQLCGYFGFLKLLIEDKRIPIIPVFIIDHISKPFDDINLKGIGKVIESALIDIGKDNLQIIMFDDKPFESMSLNPNYEDDLVAKNKSGFNPFFFAPDISKEKDETDDVI